MGAVLVCVSLSCWIRCWFVGVVSRCCGYQRYKCRQRSIDIFSSRCFFSCVLCRSPGRQEMLKRLKMPPCMNCSLYRDVCNKPSLCAALPFFLFLFFIEKVAAVSASCRRRLRNSGGEGPPPEADASPGRPSSCHTDMHDDRPW